MDNMIFIDGELVPISSQEATVTPVVVEPQLRETTDYGYARHQGGVVGDVRSAGDLLRAARLDWRVETQPIYLANGRPVEGKRAIVRTDTGYALGVASGRYGTIQNSSLAELADAILGEGDWRPAQAAESNGGRTVWMQLRTPPRDVGGLDVRSNLILSTGHDGLGAFACGRSNTWAVCKNTFAAAMKDAFNGLTLKHTLNAEQRLRAAANIARAARESDVTLDNAILALMGRRGITDDHALGMAIQLFGEADRTAATRERFIEAYRSAPGAAPGTAFGLLQAVTYHTSHLATVRGYDTEAEREQARLESTWWGRGAEMQTHAWNILADEEATQALQYVRIVRR
jgi:phage/plasmid-like protein (TIGR03299 family)